MAHMYHISEDLWKDSKKPQKAEQDTVTYLRQIEGLLDDFSRTEFNNKNNNGNKKLNDGNEAEEEDAAEEKTILVKNVFEEIKNQEAALSTDKYSSNIIEKVLNHATEEQLVNFGVGIQEYFLFLSSNRYSSHVLQTYLLLIGKQMELYDGKEEDMLKVTVSAATTADADGDNNSNNNITITISGVIYNLCASILDVTDNGDADNDSNYNRGTKTKWVSLARDICGTHVLRSLLSVLSGRQVPKNSTTGFSTKKKKKKGQKKGRGSNNQSGSIATLNDPSRKNENKRYKVPTRFTSMFTKALETIRALPQVNVYDLCFDSNASPVMQILLLYSENKTAVDDLSKHILDWDAFQTMKNKASGMEGDVDETSVGSANDAVHKWLDEMIQGRSSSHVIEAMLRGVSSNFFDILFQNCLVGRLAKYSQLPSANFVVQQLLACVRVKEQVGICVKELVVVIPEILGARTCLGVIWRLLECCIAHKTKGKDVSRALIQAASSSNRDVVESLLGFTLGASIFKNDEEEHHPHEGGGSNTDNNTNKKKKKGLYIDIAGARVIQQLLKLHFSICRPILQSIIDLPSRTLAALAKDPVGSRAVIEPVLDGVDEFNPFKQKLIDKLANCYVGLSNDRFGTYACQKCFVVATLKRKENIASELVAAFRILEGNSFGRHVVQSCKLQMFKTQKYRWMEEMRGSQNRKRVFESVFGKSKDNGSDNDDVRDDSGGSSKKKGRKRKRKKKSKGKK
jgi:hypothetical protein